MASLAEQSLESTVAELKRRVAELERRTEPERVRETAMHLTPQRARELMALAGFTD